MIISRTPFRISFVGGGTDLRAFYQHEDGGVLSTAINKYIYVVVRRQIGIVEYKYRVNWSQVEFKHKIDDIVHPIVRESLRLFEIDFPIEITTFADVPAGTGLGSSSSFAVGLIHALAALKGQMISKHELASLAAEIEVDILGRHMGKQDHFAAAYGDLNVFQFHSDETVTVQPVFYSKQAGRELQNNLLLFYTNLKRDASEILKEQGQETLNKIETFKKMRDLIVPLREILMKGGNLDEFGKILHQNWQLKKTITDQISSRRINEFYEMAQKAGALGGKLLGAGGGGFLLFYIKPEHQQQVIEALSELYKLSIKIDRGGSRITYYDNATV